MKRIRAFLALAAFSAGALVVYFLFTGDSQDSRTTTLPSEVRTTPTGAAPTPDLATAPAAESRIFVESSRAVNKPIESKTALILHGIVTGSIDERLAPLSVNFLSPASSGQSAIRLAASVSPVNGSYEFRDDGRILALLKAGEDLNMELKEGQRLLATDRVRQTDIENGSEPPVVGNGVPHVRRDFAFVPPATVIGIIVDSQNSPIAGCGVYLARMSQLSNTGQAELKAEDRTGNDGSFKLRVRDVSQASLFVFHVEYELATRVLTLPDSGRVDLGSIAMSSGVAIRGAVVAPDSRYPVAGVRVVAFPDFLHTEEYDRAAFSVGPFALQGIGEKVARMTIDTVALESGSFSILGLRKSKYRLSIQTPPPPRHDIAIPFGESAIHLEAPAENVKLHWDPPLLVARAKVDSKPAPEIQLLFRQANHIRSPATTNIRGECYYAGQVGQPVFVSAQRKGFRTAVVESFLKQRGQVVEVELKLQEVGKTQSMVLEVKDFTGRPARAISCAVIPSWSTTQFPDGWLRDLEGSNGRFEISDLEPGSYRLVIRPENWFRENEYNVPAVLDVTIEPDAKIQKHVQWERGGRVQFDEKESIEGGLVRCVFTNTQSGGASHEYLIPGGISPRNRAMKFPAIPVGVYTLTIEADGKEVSSQSIAVREGEIVTIRTTAPKK